MDDHTPMEYPTGFFQSDPKCEMETGLFLARCTDLRGISYFGEVTYQIVFQEDGNVHALVVGRLDVR